MDRLKIGQEVLVHCEVIEEIRKKGKTGIDIVYYKLEHKKADGLMCWLLLPETEVTPFYDE